MKYWEKAVKLYKEKTLASYMAKYEEDVEVYARRVALMRDKGSCVGSACAQCPMHLALKDGINVPACSESDEETLIRIANMEVVE